MFELSLQPGGFLEGGLLQRSISVRLWQTGIEVSRVEPGNLYIAHIDSEDRE